MKLLSTQQDETLRTKENIATAKKILIDLGIDNARFVAYSDSFGVSVYFKTDSIEKIRVSDHSVTNKNRMQSELLLNFDKKCFGRGGKTSFKDMSENNKYMLTNF